MAGPRIYKFVAGPARFVNGVAVDHREVAIYRRRTLYPAAYPKPGNREVNLRPIVASEYCLKMTALRFEADVI